MSRKDYVEAARIIRETPMASETRAALVARFATMFADDNARFIAGRFRLACEPEPQPCRACGEPFPYDENADYCPRCAAENACEQDRYVVVENTPGYLPEDDDPPVFHTYSDAVAYANERADEYEHDPDGRYDVDRSYASSENTYCVVVHDCDREHDLGRVIEVLRYEEEGAA